MVKRCSVIARNVYGIEFMLNRGEVKGKLDNVIALSANHCVHRSLIVLTSMKRDYLAPGPAKTPDRNRLREATSHCQIRRPKGMLQNILQASPITV